MSMIRAICVAVLCLLSMGLPAWAQNGVITGKATDASGAVLPGVELTLTSASVMGMRNTVSDEQGIYRTLNTPSLTQGVVTLQVEPSGSSFYDTVGLLDLRFTKTFSLGESLGKLEGIADAFNISNSAAVLSRSNLTGPSYNKVLTTMNPRIFRFGVRWNF